MCAFFCSLQQEISWYFLGIIKLFTGVRGKLDESADNAECEPNKNLPTLLMPIEGAIRQPGKIKRNYIIFLEMQLGLLFGVVFQPSRISHETKSLDKGYIRLFGIN